MIYGKEKEVIIQGGINVGDNINSKDFIIGTLIGGMVGATVALLFAPKSGRELRGDINQGAMQAKDLAKDWKDTAQEKGSEWKEIAQEKGTEFKQKAMDTTSDFTKSVTKKTKDLSNTAKDKLDDMKSKEDEALDAIEKVADTVEDSAEQLKK